MTPGEPIEHQSPRSSNKLWRKQSTKMSLYTLGFIILLVYLLDFGPYPASIRSVPAALLPVLWGLVYFGGVVVLSALLELNDETDQAERLWIIGYLAVSITLNIASFALAYKLLGLDHPDVDGVFRNGDYLYFSAVSFSTLGFGDFTPNSATRGFAAAQAVLGNLHLGLLVGAFVAAAQMRPPKS